MTTEIVIMNLDAVALASDSAVTMNSGSKTKIFTTANKLFMLSKHHPVGIMIYANAEMMGIPWETIIKMYRKHLDQREFDSIIQYRDDFIKYLETFNQYISKELEDAIFEGNCKHIFEGIIKLIENVINALPNTQKGIPIPILQVNEVIIKEMIKKKLQEYEENEEKSDINLRKIMDRIIQKKNDIFEWIKEIFEKIDLSDEENEDLFSIIKYAYTKDHQTFDFITTGVVISGFGTKEIFPVTSSMKIQFVFENQIYVDYSEELKVDNTEHFARIIPFAQDDVIRRFLRGVDSNFQTIIDGAIQQILKEYPHFIINLIPTLADSERTKILEVCDLLNEDKLSKVREDIEIFIEQYFLLPIFETVRVLPKDELANMAETLVNLTSFKRKFSMDSETVGGMTDVAVITKGDGFIWIKRKHYFDSKYNPYFFQKN